MMLINDPLLVFSQTVLSKFNKVTIQSGTKVLRSEDNVAGITLCCMLCTQNNDCYFCGYSDLTKQCLLYENDVKSSLTTYGIQVHSKYSTERVLIVSQNVTAKQPENIFYSSQH